MLTTIGGLASETGYAAHQIRHVLKSRKIPPILRLGKLGALVFDDAAAKRIVEELDAITVRRIPLAPEIHA